MAAFAPARGRHPPDAGAPARTDGRRGDSGPPGRPRPEAGA